MADISVFGERVRQLRTKLQLSQRDFAERIGVTASALSTYEKGQKNPSIGVAISIATEFSVSLDWLCGVGKDTSDFIPDEYTPFNLPAALHGLIDLMDHDFLCTDYSEYEEAALSDPAIAASCWVYSLRLGNGDLSEFLTSRERLHVLSRRGIISPENYNRLIDDLINSYSGIIHDKERDFRTNFRAKKQQPTQEENNNPPF